MCVVKTKNRMCVCVCVCVVLACVGWARTNGEMWGMCVVGSVWECKGNPNVWYKQNVTARMGNEGMGRSMYTQRGQEGQCNKQGKKNKSRPGTN